MKRLRNLLTIAGIAAFLVFVGTASAAPPPKATPHKIFIEGTNQTPSWMVRVDVDKPDRTYKVDPDDKDRPADQKKSELLRVKVLSEKEGYLYLFNIDPDGNIECLFPNNIQQDNKIEANKEIEIGDGSKFKLRVGTPVGNELIKAIVTKEPLKSAKPGDLIDNKRAAPKEVSAALARKIIVEALTGDPSLADGNDPIEKIRDDYKEKHPDDFKNRAGQFAEHQIEIKTATDTTTKAAEKRVGVFIGISKFQDKSIRALTIPDKDAEKMAAVMKNEGKFDTTYVLTNEKATLANIRAYICEKLVAETRPGDTVMIFWSGHGGRCANTDGSEPDGFDEFLVPYDGSLESNAAVRKTMLLDKTMGRWVQELDGRKVMVVLDTCHSGGFGAVAKGIGEKDEDFVKGLGFADKKKNKWGDIGVDKWTKSHFLATEMSRAKSIGQKDAAVLASSTAKQVSFERRQKDLSVLTYYVVEFVKKNNKTLTLKDVYDGVKDDVRKYVEDTFEGTTQTPVFSDQTVVPPAKFRP
jgi:uncharacterized caspase-like protein